MILNRNDILPAILRPGMYTGERGNRTQAEWFADAVVEYLSMARFLKEEENRISQLFVAREAKEKD